MKQEELYSVRGFVLDSLYYDQCVYTLAAVLFLLLFKKNVSTYQHLHVDWFDTGERS